MNFVVGDVVFFSAGYYSIPFCILSGLCHEGGIQVVIEVINQENCCHSIYLSKNSHFDITLDLEGICKN